MVTRETERQAAMTDVKTMKDRMAGTAEMKSDWAQRTQQRREALAKQSAVEADLKAALSKKPTTQFFDPPPGGKKR